MHTYLNWNWNKTLKGLLQISILVFLFSIVYQNNNKINSVFLSAIPVGTLLLLIVGILIVRHLYQVSKWYNLWIKSNSHFKYGNLMIHICLYLIAVSVVMSVSSSFVTSVSSDEANWIHNDFLKDFFDRWEIVGKWEYDAPVFGGAPISSIFEFNFDGTGSYQNPFGSITFDYKVKNNTIIISNAIPCTNKLFTNVNCTK